MTSQAFLTPHPGPPPQGGREKQKKPPQSGMTGSGQRSKLRFRPREYIVPRPTGREQNLSPQLSRHVARALQAKIIDRARAINPREHADTQMCNAARYQLRAWGEVNHAGVGVPEATGQREVVGSLV